MVKRLARRMLMAALVSRTPLTRGLHAFTFQLNLSSV
jgi:hypothetical protein